MNEEIKDPSRARRRELKILGKITIDTHDADAETSAVESYLCNVINMSLTGALVECGHTMSVGSLVSYAFRMPGAEATIKVLAEVVRRERGSARNLFDEEPRKEKDVKFAAPPASVEALNLYGIRFLDLKDDVRSAIKNYLMAY